MLFSSSLQILDPPLSHRPFPVTAITILNLTNHYRHPWSRKLPPYTTIIILNLTNHYRHPWSLRHYHIVWDNIFQLFLWLECHPCHAWWYALCHWKRQSITYLGFFGQKKTIILVEAHINSKILSLMSMHAWLTKPTRRATPADKLNEPLHSLNPSLLKNSIHIALLPLMNVEV